MSKSEEMWATCMKGNVVEVMERWFIRGYGFVECVTENTKVETQQRTAVFC